MVRSTLVLNRIFCCVVLPLAASVVSFSPTVVSAAAFAVHSSSASALQIAAQTAPEITGLDPMTALKVKLAGGERHSYEFPLTQGQYVTVLVECRAMIASFLVTDTTDSRVDQYDADVDPVQHTVEVAAEATGHYRVVIVNTSPRDEVGACSIELARPRAASNRELSLQQGRRLSTKAWMLMNQGKYEEALEPAEAALALREKAVGGRDQLIADSNVQLGDIAGSIGDLPKSEKILLRALDIEEGIPDARVGSVTAVLGNLGLLYYRMGEFDKAIQFFKRTLDLLEKTPGVDATIMATLIENFANVYSDKADYIEAEKLYQRSLTIREKTFGPEDASVGDTLNNLANIDASRGEYGKAEGLYRRALAIYEKGEDRSRVGYPLQGLGDVYANQGDFDRAEPFFERALKVFEQTLGAEHPFVANALNELAEIYRNHHDFEKSEAYYRRALAIREAKLGEDHPDVAQSVNGLGVLYTDRGNYSEATPLLQRALAIRQKALGPDHPDVAKSFENMARMEMLRGDFTQAEAFLSRAIAASERNADLNLLAGSEHEKLAYVGLLSSQLDQAMTLHINLAPEQSLARDLAITTVLERKGRVQEALADTFKSLRQHLGADDRKLFDDLGAVSAQLARLVLRGPQQLTLEEHQKKTAALEEQREHLEAEISRRSAEFRAASQPITLETVRAALPRNSALLEFVNYRKFLPGGVSAKDPLDSLGEWRYAVYIVRPTGQIDWKELGDADNLDGMIRGYRDALRDPKRADVTQLSRALDQKIFRPLRAAVGEASHVLISPDGQLSLIPFETLVDEQGRYAIERYSITYLSTGRDLLRLGVPRKSNSDPVLVADPLFGEPSAAMVAQARPGNEKFARAVAARRSITAADNLSSVYFAPLTGTAQEARAIQSLFPEAKVLVGGLATKSALRTLNAPTILHIATHGFFLRDAEGGSPDSETHGTRAINASAGVENPLLRSGLALAGANLSKEGSDDGILTALEASNLNLWGTKLVTLSACDTGVGEVKNGEGVYGLRRAFFLAGTESLVMSLWPVSDYVTRELMVPYYAGLKKGLGRGEALRQAQLALLKRKDRKNPFYWASFIQAGEWASLDGQR